MPVKIVDIRDKAPTAQEVFDFVSAHLFAQGRPARGEKGAICQYRTATGLSCAAGCTLREDEYRPEMDDADYLRARTGEQGTQIHNVISAGLWPERLTDHAELLSTLQTVHDSLDNLESADKSIPYSQRKFDEWALKMNLERVGKGYGLDVSILNELHLAADPVQ